jgi:DMSO/TMAO reductase YedYZ molybdopterin-dependent catalytic subunit
MSETANNVNNKPGDSDDAEATIRRLSRRAFLWSGLAVGGTLGGLFAFNKYGREQDGAKAAFRRVLGINEALSRGLLFSPTHRAPTFPRSAAIEPRNNYHGETPVIDLDAWRLRLTGAEGENGKTRTLTLADIQALPRVSETTELKCIEGWSAITNWTGARFADFARAYPPPPGTKYVALVSEPDGYPDERYHVGLDIESALHPQTLLAYAMNDAPLNAAHGAPLRLIIPVKYGIKSIKLITHIAYSATRPGDYWAEQGYDWYAGL